MNQFQSLSARSSKAWSRLAATEIRAAAMLTHHSFLPYRAWLALDARLDAHARNLRMTSTLPGRHGRVWCNQAALTSFLRLRKLQIEVAAQAQAALICHPMAEVN